MSSLLLNYRLNEIDANIGTDTEGLQNATNTTVTSFTDATFGNVAYFDGLSDLTIPAVSIPSQMVGTSSRSYSFWANPSTFGSNRVLFANGDAASGQRFRIQTLSSGLLGYDFFGVVDFSSGSLVIGSWAHIVVVYDLPTTTLTIYLDNVSIYSNASVTIDTGTTGDFGIAKDSTSGTAGFDGYMADFRVYDGSLTPAEVTALFSDGVDSEFLNVELCTHVADISWGPVSGASTYTIVKTQDGGTVEIPVISDTSTLLYTDYTLSEGTAYTFILYTDVNPTVPVLTIAGTTPIIDSANVTLLLTKIGNDVSLLPTNSLNEISSYLRDIFTTGDSIVTSSGDAKFVENAGTLALTGGATEVVLTPFDVSGGSGQTVTITLPDASSEVLTYDELTDEIVSNSVNYGPGEYFPSGVYKVSVKNL